MKLFVEISVRTLVGILRCMKKSVPGLSKILDFPGSFEYTIFRVFMEPVFWGHSEESTNWLAHGK